MRITHIRIRNLASLAGTQPEIVLGPGGLAGGLVAVTGATGAGKSTILDCVCLALYGDTPRLKGRGEDHNASNILTRGASDGFAEVDFLDDQDVIYRARWEIERNRNGHLKPPQMSLLCLKENEQIARGIRETQDQVTRIIGLDRNQFVGVVLLAQGSFSTFMSGDIKDRGALLERLSGSDTYSRLGRAAHAYLTEAKAAVEKIEHQLGENPLLDAIRRQELEDQISQTDERSRHANGAAEAATALTKQLLDCQQACAAVTQATAQQQQDLQAQAALADQRTQLAAAEKLEPLRTPLGVLDDRQRQLDTQRQQQRDIASEHQRVAAQGQERQHALTQTMGRMQTLLQQLHQRHQEASASAPQDADALTQAQHLQQEHHNALQQLEKLKANSQKIAEQIPQAEQTVAQHTAALEAARAQLAQTDQALSAAQEALQQAEIQGGDSEQRSAILHGRQQLPHWFEEHCALSASIQRGDADLQTLDAQAETAHSQANALQQRITQQTAALDSARTVLQLAQTEAAVSEHRHSLVAGEACPLCLQEVHTVPASDDAHHPLPQASAHVKALQKELEQQHTQAASLAARIQALPQRRTELSQQRTQAQQQQGKLAERYAALREHDAALPAELAALDDDQCRNLISAASDAVAALKATASALTAAQQQQQKASQAAQQAQHTLTSTQAQLANLRTQLTERQSNQQQAASRVQELEQSLSTDLAQLAGDCNGEAPALDQAAAWLQGLRKALTRAQEWQRLHSRVADRFAERLGELQAELPAGTSISIVEASLSADAEDATEQLDSAAKGIKTDYQAWSSARDQGHELSTRLGTLASSIASKESEYRTLQHELEERCHQHALADLAALRDALLPADTVESLRRQLSAADQACIRSSSALDAAQQQLQQRHQACGPALPALESEDFTTHLAQAQDQAAARLQHLKQEAEDLRSQLATLRAALATDDHNRQRAGTLREALERAQADHQRIAQLHHLIGSHDGSKFRDLAQAFTLEHLIHHANRRLARFAPRYALRRRDGLALEVIDRDLADETRAVTTLSGGETFLVSLGLALALADLKRGRAHIGTVFIDEGFGSLDTTSLEHALDALVEVQADLGAQLVVISHVGDLASRWDDGIRVRRTSRGRSWLLLPGGSDRPPKDAQPIPGNDPTSVDTVPIRNWLATQSRPQSRASIAKALNIPSDTTLAKALKADPEIVMVGRSYTVEKAS